MLGPVRLRGELAKLGSRVVDLVSSKLFSKPSLLCWNLEIELRRWRFETTPLLCTSHSMNCCHCSDYSLVLKLV